MTSRVISVEDCGPEGFKWITLKRITWEDPAGRRRLWESAERTTRRGAVDGVAVVAKVISRGRPPMLPVLKQYRPPVASYCLELPAGLVDAEESAGQAAVRELLEETGYHGKVVEETGICVSDPGMSNANMVYVKLEVDADAPENQNVVQQLEDGEFIQVELVPWDGLMQHLQAEVAATGCQVDARLLSYALGLEHAKEAAASASAAAAAQQQRQQGLQEEQQLGQQRAGEAGTKQQQQQRQQQQQPSASLPAETGGSWATLPFGSPIMSAQASFALPHEGPPLSGSPAAHAAAARHGKPLLAGWPLFAAGVAAGAAATWLLLAERGRTTRVW